jgi:Na+/H+ antiporter NhaD/arsenite permease-like protein
LNTLVIVALVYIGLIFGRPPWIQLDRTGIALLGAIALFGFQKISLPEAIQSIDFPTILLLFSMMVISAQLRLGGFYSAVVQKVTDLSFSPGQLLGITILVAGLLSAVLTNDVVCFAIAPVLLAGTVNRGLNPIPFLLGLACAANVGSAATILGNPQNILIGQSLKLSFSKFLWQCGVPALVGLVVTWGVIWFVYRRSMTGSFKIARVYYPPFNPWQSAKGLIVITVAVLAFFYSEIPREIIAISAAGLLLMSRRLHSREVLELVDWHLLILFLSLFVVHRALEDTAAVPMLVEAARQNGVHLSDPATLFVLSPVLSNLVSNVPAVMLLLPFARIHESAPAALALSSTLAGNLLLIGSIANLIVLDQAKRMGVSISWKEHAKVGVPVTVFSLALAAMWLWVVF